MIGILLQDYTRQTKNRNIKINNDLYDLETGKNCDNFMLFFVQYSTNEAEKNLTNEINQHSLNSQINPFNLKRKQRDIPTKEELENILKTKNKELLILL